MVTFRAGTPQPVLILILSKTRKFRRPSSGGWALSRWERAALPGTSWACHLGASCPLPLIPFPSSPVPLPLSLHPSSTQTHSRPFVSFLSWLHFPFLKSDRGIREGVPLEQQRTQGNKGETIPSVRPFFSLSPWKM